ncbi:MAG TPA: hypothetical protein VGG08_06105 [Solirubrobacteraceae bacterium]|jgi:hypothetical protein
MARVLVLTGDLLFGSQLQGSLTAAGHAVELKAEGDAVRDGLPADALLVDLTDAAIERCELFEALAREGALGTTRTLAYYSHVEADVRERADGAGFRLIVPRSRMAREAPAVLASLLDGSR